MKICITNYNIFSILVISYGQIGVMGLLVNGRETLCRPQKKLLSDKRSSNMASKSAESPSYMTNNNDDNYTTAHYCAQH